MCPKSDERDANDEKEDSCIRKVAEHSFSIFYDE